MTMSALNLIDRTFAAEVFESEVPVLVDFLGRAHPDREGQFVAQENGTWHSVPRGKEGARPRLVQGHLAVQTWLRCGRSDTLSEGRRDRG